MGITATAGAKIYIGTTAAAANIAAYEADTYVEIKEVQDLGEFGDEAAEIEVTAVGDARKRRLKGTRDAGLLNLVCYRDPLDAGQQALIAAEKTADAYNLKIVADDAPIGGTPTTFYMKVLAMSAKLSFSGPDDVTSITFALAINSDILEETAEAA
ncbi:MAG: hypothetical protein B7Y12_03825 [Rhizobiales bacterium 24-66-13]|jgi:hypothetical protein|nr:MAG: hypothetical protein B7Y61_03540 [Rhizobiales bacterium 35-66-30]OYZ82359.1 MAG: hypothetical protein B7Y12_03825 [Rhizobiales bacterium 24-66-13]OZB10709.1 MAG: hypothetical protein B7X67_06100 [Rhizobiales bacterium 39-66-18]HQS46925.1 iron ABC transporter substrate-binding protein [Xanthobacteraceae bacterium]